MEFLIFSLVVGAADLGALFLMFIYFRRKFRAEISSGEVLEKARREIGSLVAELNRTTERNVSLLEDRIAEAKDAVEYAAKGFEAIRREKEARERERAAYDRMARVRPLVRGPGGQAPAERKPEAKPSSPEPRPGESRAARAAAPSAEPPASSAKTPALPEIKAASERISTEEPAAETALRLWERGFSAEIIAARVGMSVAEVDLVIAMEEQRRLTAR